MRMTIISIAYRLTSNGYTTKPQLCAGEAGKRRKLGRAFQNGRNLARKAVCGAYRTD